MKTLTLAAPLQGWVAPLSEVPDDVFAQGMVGKGVAIDPTDNTLYAPCAGEVISIATTQHAVTMRADNGAEVLMHVGLDTVALKGEGFSLCTRVGQRVQAGDPLLTFDLDLLARRARSVITPIVVTNAEGYDIDVVASDRGVSVGELLLHVSARAAQSSNATSDRAVDEQLVELVVHHEHGLHARPAALIAHAVKQYEGDVALGRAGKRVNARSAVALMTLGARQGDAVTLSVAGPHVQNMIRELAPLIGHPRTEAAIDAPVSSSSRVVSQLKGVVASRGFALGQAVHLHAPELDINPVGAGVTHESAALDKARADVRDRLYRLLAAASTTAREVMQAHVEFLDDWEMVATAKRSIARGKSAAYAWRQAVRESADALEALGDARMAERVDDLKDVETQVLLALAGRLDEATRVLPQRAVLIADELKPSQLVALDATRIAGIATAAGGATSHVAILAASMGVPALAALGRELLEIAEGEWLIVDAESGTLTVAEDHHALEQAEQAIAARTRRRASERERAAEECRTLDGTRIEIFANLGSVADAQLAVSCGAEGCGLLRTEFMFLDRSTAPDEHEQARQYQAIVRSLGERPLTLRTLDVGGDKPLAYLRLPAEPNPALGLRGLRTSLWRPDVLRTQLRAILRVQNGTTIRVLLPMITDVAEVLTVRSMLEEVQHELDVTSTPQMGVMIETPASALIAQQLARHVDFFSIGTNDLTQYTLAMDREHPELAARADGLHPAVLRLIAMTVEAAGTHDRAVAVCGGLAGDPAAASILIGLGVHELSMAPTLIPSLKAFIRTLSLNACIAVAREALTAASADEVRALAARLHRPAGVPSGELT